MTSLMLIVFFFFNDTATTEIYTLSLHDALPIFAPVPHRVLVPRMTERVEVGGRHPVIEDAVVVRREAALAARQRAHVVVRGQRIVQAGLLGERATQRDAPPGPYEARRGGPLGRRDEVDRAELVVLPPSSP